MAYEIIKMTEGTWRIENDGVRFFLLTGSREALLIDCGMTVKGVSDLVRELTDLPVRLLITHADRDHIGDVDAFDSFYMHPAEAAFFYHETNADADYMPVYDGDRIDLGDRLLEIVHLPGHTPGSIGVLDPANRTLFSGDPVQDGLIYMFGPQREMRTYIKTLRRLEGMRDRFDTICPSHASIPVGPEMIGQLADAAEGILAGRYSFEETEAHGFAVRKYDVGTAVFLTD